MRGRRRRGDRGDRAGRSRPTLAHAIGPLRAVDRARHGAGAARVEFIHPDPRLVALSPDGRALAFSTDIARTADAIGAFSAKDAARYPEFCARSQRLGGFPLAPAGDDAAVARRARRAGEIWDLLKTGRRFRALGRTDGFRLLRWMPMAVADLVAEWFETDLLQAAIAARGIFGTAQGPWSAGTGAVLLLNAATDPVPGGSSVMVKGGPGALTRRDGRGGARSRRRDPRRRAVVADPRPRRARRGRRPRGREELPAIRRDLERRPAPDLPRSSSTRSSSIPGS